MKYLFDCRATSPCTAKILFKALSFSELFRSCFAVSAERFRKFGVGVSQRPVCLNTSVKRGYDILHRPRRHSENIRYPRGIYVSDMQQFGCHVPSIDYLRLSRFGEDGFFRYVKFLGYGFKDIVGEFCNLWHDCDGVVRRHEQNVVPRVIKVYERLLI